jgi:uncharacterized protein YabN with tetrapyrrole methylase and pyrophosphatase domain
MVSSKNEKASIFEGIPEDLPSLSYAYRLTQKAARLGFDWPDLAEVLKKMDEELGEFREALAQSPRLRGGAARSRSLRITTPAPAASPSQGRGKESLLIRCDATLQNRRRIAEEFGDLLFVLVNVARFLRIDPEAALKETIRKFGSRFHYIETSLRRAGKTVQESNLVEMDRLWEEAKRKRKTQR